ncbi:MAG: hypothetical protein H0V37_10470 [Chloroflexia bacterium]|nr:hypothetical protein [Chloroflexia bacterium]
MPSLNQLTLWTTQHPCSMCAAAIAFVGIGEVWFIADDPSDHSSHDLILASHGSVPYRSLGDPLWWTVSNLLFLYNSAVLEGERARNIEQNRDRYTELVSLTLEFARIDTLGASARSGTALPVALASHLPQLEHVAGRVP